MYSNVVLLAKTQKHHCFFFNIYLRAFTNQYDVREQEYKRLSSIPEPVWTLFLYTVGQVDGTGTPINL